MQRICKFLIVILFFSIATECVGANKDLGLEVRIPDSNLESAIREAINKSSDAPIYVEDLEGLTELDAEIKGITDITGLNYCTNLTWLNLSGNKITNIAPLSNLVNLRALLLSINAITDISPLSKLVNLRLLELSFNEITDISPLSGLVNLEMLGLQNNKITDIAPLSQLVNLETLNLQNNKIINIEPLVHNPGLSDGDIVFLAGNLLGRLSINDNILQLWERGVIISSEEQRP